MRVALAAAWLAGLAHAAPHLVVIVVDDLGHADVGWTNPSMRPLTPNLDALAGAGVKLTALYVQPVCSPTRGALLTARYPMRWGLLHHTFNNDDRFSLFTNETLMPEARTRVS